MSDRIREAFVRELWFTQNLETDNFKVYRLGYKAAEESLKCCGNCGNRNSLGDIGDGPECLFFG